MLLTNELIYALQKHKLDIEIPGEITNTAFLIDETRHD